jgi:hypothetical protein
LAGGQCDQRHPIESGFPGVTAAGLLAARPVYAPDLHSPAALPFGRAATFSYRSRHLLAHEPAAGLVDGGEEVLDLPQDLRASPSLNDERQLSANAVDRTRWEVSVAG